MQDSVVFLMFVVFTGASLLATLALYTRQSMLVAYIVLGMIAGPFGLKWVSNPELIQNIADIGILFLLFLLGLNLHPQNLLRMLSKATRITLISSAAFVLVGYSVALAFGYSQIESLVIGVACIFSSTIIGLKLLPTTVLHHQHTGEVVISILLMQDLLAILAMLFVQSGPSGFLEVQTLVLLLLALPGLILFCFLFHRFVLIKLIGRFDIVQEYIFLVAIGWCLGISELAKLLGLSHEMGAFIAGVALAASPISLYIAESLKPLRDFFLILFFFSLGAGFNTQHFFDVALAASILAVLMLIIKPVALWWLIKNKNEGNTLAWDVGFRLGHLSEFSLLVGYLATQSGMLSQSAYSLIQASTIITFIVASYVIVMYFPTPMGFTEKLRRN